MVLYTLLHTCSRSSTLSMGEWLLCIRLSFFFALSTPWASRTGTRTPRRCSAPSWQACRLLVNLCSVPSCVWSESSIWPNWTFSGFSTQPNKAFSKASSALGGGGIGVGGEWNTTEGYLWRLFKLVWELGLIVRFKIICVHDNQMSSMTSAKNDKTGSKTVPHLTQRHYSWRRCCSTMANIALFLARFYC